MHASAQGSSSGEGTVRRRVVIADDHPDSREFLIAFFRMYGLEPIPAEDGVQALDLCRQHKPDLVLLDIWMPRMTGMQACLQLRSDESLHHLMIYAVTADPTLSHAECFDGFLMKPVQLSDLLELVQRL